jgi:hypothetical protein
MNATELLDSLPEEWREVPLKAVCNYKVSNVDYGNHEDN